MFEVKFYNKCQIPISHLMFYFVFYRKRKGEKKIFLTHTLEWISLNYKKIYINNNNNDEKEKDLS